VNRLRQQPPSPGNIKIADEGSCPSLRAVLGLKANDVCHLLDMTSMVQVGRLPLEVMHEFKQTYLYALTGVCNLPIRSRSAASSKLANSSEDSRGALSHMARRAGLTMPGLPGEAAHGADDLPAAARAVTAHQIHVRCRTRRDPHLVPASHGGGSVTLPLQPPRHTQLLLCPHVQHL
jgi:hypothetical protein